VPFKKIVVPDVYVPPVPHLTDRDTMRDPSTDKLVWTPEKQAEIDGLLAANIAAIAEASAKIEAQKDRHNKIAKKSYHAKVSKNKLDNLSPYHEEAPEFDDARKYFIESGVRNVKVMQFCFDAYKTSADILGIPFNRSTVAIGPLVQAKELGKIEEDSRSLNFEAFDNPELMGRERLFLPAELRAIWQFCGGVGKYIGESPAKWLDDRQNWRHDLYFGASQICDKTLDLGLHSQICNWFGHLDDSKFPRDYTQDDIRKLLLEHFDGPRVRMLWSYRGSYKSTLNVLRIGQLMTICPNFTFLVLSAFKDLGAEFVTEFKKYWIYEDLSMLTRLQSLFPEFCLKASKAGDEKSFESPLAKNFGKESLLKYSSSNSGLGGQHYYFIAGDDYVLPKNSTPALRPGLAAKYRQAKELLNQGGRIWLIGTPYFGGTPGVEGDLYHELLKENEKAGGDMLFLRIPAYTVKPGFEKVEIHKLEEHMVSLARMDGRLTWKDLKEDLGSKPESEINFRRQKLCEGVADPEEEDLHIFKESAVDDCIMDPSMVPGWAAMNFNGDTYQFWDLAYSARPTSDESAGLVVSRAIDPATSLSHLFVRGLWYGRVESSELATQIVIEWKNSIGRRYPFRAICIERMAMWQHFQDAINEQARMRITKDDLALLGRADVRPPLNFFSVDTQPDAKNLRIRALQLLVASKRIHFIANDLGATGWDKMRAELLAFDGKPSTRLKTDNVIDVLSLAAKHLHVIGEVLLTKPQGFQTPEQYGKTDQFGRTPEEQEADFRKKLDSEEFIHGRERLAEMMFCRRRIEDDQQRAFLKANATKAEPETVRVNGIYIRKPAPIDASGRRDPATGQLVSRYGYPVRGKN